MSSSTDPASRLAFHVKWRRGNLALNQMEVWQAGGPSNTTLTEIENGRISNLTVATAKKLDKGLRWEPGSAMRVWRDEGRPTQVETVGGPTQDAEGGYVSSPGPRVDGGASDSAVLDAIQQMQRDMQAMEQRLSDKIDLESRERAALSERVERIEGSGS